MDCEVIKTQLLRENEEIYINQYANGTFTKVINGIEELSSIEEFQSYINSGQYDITVYL